MRCSILMVVVAVGCGGAVPESAEPGMQATAEADPPTRYREGDWVRYRYAFAEGDDVILEERIVSQQGLQLVIEVTSEGRGPSQRWRQHVTDTLDNQRSDTIDRLEVLEDGEWREVSPEPERIMALYAAVLPPCSFAPEEGSWRRGVEEPVELLGERLTCRCSNGPGRCDEAAAAMRVCACDDFLWTNALQELTVDGEVVYSMHPEAAGPTRPGAPFR